MSATVVTCYYIIPNKRSHGEFETWIKNFLSIPCNLYIFTDNKSIDVLQKYRPSSYNTFYHILDIENFHVTKYDDLWNYSLEIDIEKKSGTNHTVELYKIWAEKIFMCRKAIENNVFHSEIFCWTDIGCVRNPDLFPRVLKFPNGLTHSLQKDKVMFSLIQPFERDDFNINSQGIAYIFQNKDANTSCNCINRIQGGFFAGYKNSLLKYAQMFDDELELFNRTKTFAGKDQYVMTNLYMKNREIFQIINSYIKDIYHDEWFSFLIRFSDVPFITCQIEGGLGNQLFQISHALCLAWKTGSTAVFEKVKPPVDVSDRPHYWDSIFGQLTIVPNGFTSNWHHIGEHGNSYSPISINSSHGGINYKLRGYWQTSKYFYGYEDKLRKLFEISEEYKYHLIQKLLDAVSASGGNCCAIHVRRTDYVKLKWNLPIEYYLQCIEEESKRNPGVNFIIFSDEPEWCRIHLPNIPIFEYGNEVDQLYALSLCNNIIMANSSFSWWAVFLNKNVGQVYTPEPWFPSFQSYNLDIYQKDWKRIKVNFYE